MISIDIGNAVTALYDGQTISTLPSLLAPVSGLLNRRTGGGFVYSDGRYYHVGENAKRYAAYMSMMTQDKEERVTEAILLVYPLLASVFVPGFHNVDAVVQVPDTYGRYHTNLTNKLRGIHVFTVDDKEYHFKLNIKGVYQEGFGTWVVNSRTIQGSSLVIDIGGGTAIATLIDNETAEVYATANYGGSGIVKLFSLVRDDINFRHEAGGLQLEYSTMSAMAANGDELLNKYIKNHARNWWKTLFQGRIVRDFATQIKQGDITQIILTGGGSLFVKPFIDAAQAKGGIGNLFSMAQDPLYDNIVGIYDYAPKSDNDTLLFVEQAN